MSTFATLTTWIGAMLANLGPIWTTLQIPGTQRNWTGKLAELILSLALLAGFPTLRPTAGLGKPRATPYLLLLFIPISLTLSGRFLFQQPLRVGPEAALFVLFSPVVEELTYRGVLMAWLDRTPAWWRVGFPAFLFGLAHMVDLSSGFQFLGGNADLIVWGLALGIAREKCGSIWPGALAHIVANAVLIRW